MSGKALGCNEFRPHQLRPDKCRNCFGDTKQHEHPSTVSNPLPTQKASNAVDERTINELDKPEGEEQQLQQVELGSCGECRRRDEEINRLRVELEEWQTRCRAAEEDNQRVREEVRCLEREMDEMHDNFKEEESEQFEQLKQELDGAVKNCKILQIRLNKSERQYSQLEQVKSLLERQLEERTEQTSNDNQSRPTSNQQQVSVNFAQMGPDFVKLSTREYDQLLRDLNDTIEREKDLQEQIKYSQEEAQLKGERLQAIELENEVLLARINKLTLTNSRLRSSLPSIQQHQQTSEQQHQPGQQQQIGFRDSLEQNEQLKLALEVAQSECQRLKAKLQELSNLLEAKESRLAELEAAAASSRQQQNTTTDSNQSGDSPTTTQANPGRLELECRQLRARLVHSERDCRQLKAQLELFASSGGAPNSTAGATSARRANPTRSQSMESPGGGGGECQSSRCQETFRRLEEQCKSLRARNADLETKVQRLSMELRRENDDGHGGQQFESSHMESDLLEKLKKQVDVTENELAKARSRLVELDLECGRAQRQYKRLLNSLESCGTDGELQSITRKSKLIPGEAARDSMSRQELRQAVQDLESELEEMAGLVRAKDILIKEIQESDSMARTNNNSNQQVANDSANDSKDEQLKSLRRLIDQERLLSNNLKLDVANLEERNHQLDATRRMLERERVCMSEEVDKMRQVTLELRQELEESERDKASAQNRSRELNESLEKLRVELRQALNRSPQSGGESQQQQQQPTKASSTNDLLLMARDMSELKVKNGFLMRQLEMAREDTTRQLDELRESSEAQLRRAVELAQLEVRERQLNELQQLRDELADLKQRLGQAQRQVTRQEEETNLERDKVRAMERDWRRDKSQWQQQREQLEAQWTIERRSSEFKLKEAESLIRDKERALIGVQDRCVQLERDLKRLQNKSHLLEEDYETRLKHLQRELDVKVKQFNELSDDSRKREHEYYETNRRLNSEKVTLSETLETLRKSYQEKLGQLRQLNELFKSRQEQSLRERSQTGEQVEMLTARLDQMSELETQAKLSKQRLELVERQLESARRELSQLKEDRTRLRSRCEELEKRELNLRTSTISGAGGGLLRAASPFGRSSSTKERQPPPSPTPSTEASNSTNQVMELQQTIERLSGKINDQRHLINMLRQQLNETQLELKQLKLIQASERNKWQARVAILTSRVNECEEKLAYETTLMAQNPELLEQVARPKLDRNWARERQANIELIQQQQAQMELLSKDLKKVSQAHDLLRLHSKQLEAHNNKLSKKLIEYQQQQHQVNNHMSSTPTSVEMRYKISELERQREELRRQNGQLTKEMLPFVEIVGKIVSSLDAPDNSQPATLQQPPSRPISSDSTNRPLRAPAPLGQRRQSDDSELSLAEDQNVAAAGEHHKQQSRLARLLVGRPTAATTASGGVQSGSPGPASSDTNEQRPKKSMKRVRVKCSSLGITTNEKKQLKMQLKILAEAMSGQQNTPNLSAYYAHLDPAHERPHQARAVSETSTQSSPAGGSGPASTHSRSIARELSPHSSHIITPGTHHQHPNHQPANDHHHHLQNQQVNRGVHWQSGTTTTLTTTNNNHSSELDSDRSWSAEPSQLRRGSASDTYRRFPQATPSSSGYGGGPIGSSLTDYESESSLASDYSLSTFAPARVVRPSGAESDSGLASGSAVGARKRPKGLKGRLTSTLRNIGRSITGFGSDSEADGGSNSAARTKRNKKKAAGEGADGGGQASVSSSTSSLAPPTASHMREIRV